VEPSDHGAGPEHHGRAAGISVQTLIIASAASASASYAIARVWGPGTLIGAAAAPVIVALVSEVLRRPLQTVSASAKKLPAARTRPTEVEHTAPAPVPSDADTARWRPRWWMAVVTGLTAFAIVVCAYTVPDLLTGHSITDNGQPTTFFGGTHTTTSKPAPTTTITKTTTTATVTRTTQAAPKPRTTSTASTTTPTLTSTSSTAPTVTTTAGGTSPGTTSSPQTTPTTTPAP
jgi:hypothetical protein